jgi:hypothetical protein
MTPEEFLKNAKETPNELNLGLTLLTLINLQSLQTEYLKSILKTQIEIKELIKGNTEIDDNTSCILESLEKKIHEVSNSNYLNMVRTFLK